MAKGDFSLSEFDVEQFNEFKSNFPEIADLLLNPEKVNDTEHPLFEEMERESWASAAMDILNMVKKAKGAKIFYTPVDYVKLGIPDYPDLVKNPMDFGTIKVS
jgi:hypothetical protein